MITLHRQADFGYSSRGALLASSGNFSGTGLVGDKSNFSFTSDRFLSSIKYKEVEVKAIVRDVSFRVLAQINGRLSHIGDKRVGLAVIRSLVRRELLESFLASGLNLSSKARAFLDSSDPFKSGQIKRHGAKIKKLRELVEQKVAEIDYYGKGSMVEPTLDFYDPVDKFSGSSGKSFWQLSQFGKLVFLLGLLSAVEGVSGNSVRASNFSLARVSRHEADPFFQRCPGIVVDHFGVGTYSNVSARTFCSDLVLDELRNVARTQTLSGKASVAEQTDAYIQRGLSFPSRISPLLQRSDIFGDQARAVRLEYLAANETLSGYSSQSFNSMTAGGIGSTSSSGTVLGNLELTRIDVEQGDNLCDEVLTVPGSQICGSVWWPGHVDYDALESLQHAVVTINSTLISYFERVGILAGLTPLSASPTIAPSYAPSHSPTHLPTFSPTSSPTYVPTAAPTFIPSSTPTYQPSRSPSNSPTAVPTWSPSGSPTASPSFGPTLLPSFRPTWVPTMNPSDTPSQSPTYFPSINPTGSPTVSPTSFPTGSPTFVPTIIPSISPTGAPSAVPTMLPTHIPTGQPTLAPTTLPTGQPVLVPTVQMYVPTLAPSGGISLQPTLSPTGQPRFYFAPTSSGLVAFSTASPTVSSSDQDSTEDSGAWSNLEVGLGVFSGMLLLFLMAGAVYSQRERSRRHHQVALPANTVPVTLNPAFSMISIREADPFSISVRRARQLFGVAETLKAHLETIQRSFDRHLAQWNISLEADSAILRLEKSGLAQQFSKTVRMSNELFSLLNASIENLNDESLQLNQRLGFEGHMFGYLEQYNLTVIAAQALLRTLKDKLKALTDLEPDNADHISLSPKISIVNPVYQSLGDVSLYATLDPNYGVPDGDNSSSTYDELDIGSYYAVARDAVSDYVEMVGVNQPFRGGEDLVINGARGYSVTVPQSLLVMSSDQYIEIGGAV